MFKLCKALAVGLFAVLCVAFELEAAQNVRQNESVRTTYTRDTSPRVSKTVRPIVDSGVAPIFRVEFGPSADCTDTSHCSDTTCADNASPANITCNASGTPSPSGGEYAEFDCLGTSGLDFEDKFSEDEIWVKFWWYPDNITGAFSVQRSIIEAREGGSPAASLGCGATYTRWETGRTDGDETFRIAACGTSSVTADPSYTDQTWQEMKVHFNNVTGVTNFWLPGSDFTAACNATNCVTVDGVEEASPDPITGILTSDDTDGCDLFRIDDIRVYNQDPDRPVGSTLFTANFEGGTADCTDAGHCSDASACAATAGTQWSCNVSASPSPAGGAYMATISSGSEAIDFRDKFAGHDIWTKFYHYYDDNTGGLDGTGIGIDEAAGVAPVCGASFWRVSAGSTQTVSSLACGVTGTSGSAPDYTDSTWQQWKWRFDVKRGISQLWLPGSDFTALCGSTDCIEANGSASAEATPDLLEGFRFGNDTDTTEERWDGIEVFDHNPDRALTDPIFTMDFEGGTSDCTDAGHCSSGSGCATTDTVPTTAIDCNGTASPSPAGGAYAEFDVAGADTIAITDKFSEHEIWVKFYLYADATAVAVGPDVFVPFEAGTTNIVCGTSELTFDNLSTRSAPIRMCGTTASTSANPDYGNAAWEEWKLYFNVHTGVAKVWYPGSDFSGASDETADGAEEAEPDPIQGFKLTNSTNFDTAFRMDNIRIYDRDPD